MSEKLCPDLLQIVKFQFSRLGTIYNRSLMLLFRLVSGPCHSLALGVPLPRCEASTNFMFRPPCSLANFWNLCIVLTSICGRIRLVKHAAGVVQPKQVGKRYPDTSGPWYSLSPDRRIHIQSYVAPAIELKPVLQHLRCAKQPSSSCRTLLKEWKQKRARVISN